MNNVLLSSLKTKEIIKANNNYDDEQIYARVWSMWRWNSNMRLIEPPWKISLVSIENVISFVA